MYEYDDGCRYVSDLNRRTKPSLFALSTLDILPQDQCRKTLVIQKLAKIPFFICYRMQSAKNRTPGRQCQVDPDSEFWILPCEFDGMIRFLHIDHEGSRCEDPVLESFNNAKVDSP